MQLKSAWQIQRKGGEITTLHSYKVDENELEKNSREELLESFRKIANEITPVTSSLETNSVIVIKCYLCLYLICI